MAKLVRIAKAAQATREETWQQSLYGKAAQEVNGAALNDYHRVAAKGRLLAARLELG